MLSGNRTAQQPKKIIGFSGAAMNHLSGCKPVPAARAGKRIMENIGKRNGGRFNRETLVWLFELLTVTALQILIMAVVSVATVILFVLFAHNVYTRATEIQS